MHDITWLHHMYYTNPESDNIIELVVSPSVLENQEGGQQESPPNGNTDYISHQKENTDDAPSADDEEIQPKLPTTRSWRIQTRPTKLQDFENQHHATCYNF